jgi:succinyl-diaminopimelate desuccinylase
MTNFEHLDQQIRDTRQAMIKMQKKLTSFAAVGPDNDGPGEMEKAMWLKDWLMENDFPEVHEYHAPDDRVAGGLRPNLITVIPGKNNKRTVWILAHTDVVPAGDLDKWDSDPFTVVEKDGKLIGRGVEDNQQGLVSGLFAARAILTSNTEPTYNIGLALVADEETGSHYGLHYLLEHHPDIFSSDDIVIIPDAGAADGSQIEVAEKSILWVKFKTTGKQCHASTPAAGTNAFRAASNLVVKLDEELHRKFPQQNRLFDPPESTFEPTLKEANVPNINTIPGDDVFALDCRILPEVSVDEVLAEIRRLVSDNEERFGVKIDLTFPQEERAAPPTPVDAPVVRTLQKAIAEVYKVEGKPMGIGGGTFAAMLRRQGIDCGVWSTLEDTCHQPNEYCLVESMVNDARVMLRTFMTDVDSL